MSIQDAVARAGEYLLAHPAEARYRDAVATARPKAGLRMEVTGPGGERLETDMPTGIGGTATMPSPGWYLRAATASCVATLIAIRAAATGITVRRLAVSVDSESDDRGILGLDSGIPAGPLSTRVVVELDAAAGDATAADALIAWAIEHCPVTDAIVRAIPIDVQRV